LKNKILKMVIVIIILLIIIDQISKFIVIKHFSDYTPNGAVGIQLTQNTGMAFGFNDGNTRNIVLSMIVIIIIFNFMRTQKEIIDTKTYVAISIILSGGFSNLIDRIFRGGIVDFIKIYKFPIFNLADTFIFIGWALIIIFLIKYTRKKETKVEDDAGQN